MKYRFIKIIAFFLLAFNGFSKAEIIKYSKEEIENKNLHSNLMEIKGCAERGDEKCLTLLGGAYYWGMRFKDEKIDKNIIASEKYLRKSLVKSATSRLLLAQIIEKKPGESKALIISSALSQYAPAVYYAGHYKVLNNDKEIKKSIYWRKKLIELADGQPMIEYEYGYIGNLYMQLSSPDYCNAIYWYKKASDKIQDPNAQLNLAQLYAEGIGVPKDVVQSYMYYDLLGTASLDAKATLTKMMTPEQIKEAITLSHRWQDEHHAYSPGYGPRANGGGITWKEGR